MAPPYARGVASLKLDSLLSRSDTQEIVDAVDALRRERRLSGRGTIQSNGKGRQFQFAVDERHQWWTLAFDDGERQWFRDGIVSRPQDEPRPAEFFHPLPQLLQMLWPAKLLTWAPRGSFYPVLVQRVGRRSLLITFEHVDDPAFRQTLVVDEETGIAKRFTGFGHAIIFTSIESLDAWDPDKEPVFAPLRGPIPTDY